jgi:hypothetical protein
MDIIKWSTDWARAEVFYLIKKKSQKTNNSPKK